MSEQQNIEEKQTDPIMDLALSIGFNPDFDGENKRTAEEFLKHGVKVQRDQSSKIKEMAGKFDDLNKTFRANMQMQEDKHKSDLIKQRESIEAKIEVAVDEADGNEFKKLNKELKDVDTEVAGLGKTETKNEMREKFEEWHSDKAGWLTQGSVAEKEMTKAIALFRIDRSGQSAKMVNINGELAAAEKHLKEKFPAEFGLKPAESAPGGSVGEGKQSGGKETAVKVSDLNTDELSHFKTMKRLLGKKWDEKQELENITLGRKALKKKGA